MPGAERASLAELWLSEGELARSGTIEKLWQWLADPVHANAERAFFASHSRPPSHQGEPQACLGRESVTEWLPVMVCLLDHQPSIGSQGRHAAVRPSRSKAASSDELHEEDGRGSQTAATLVLAVLHGLLFDLLTTGDDARVQLAFGLFGTVLDALTEQPDP
jgi:hypothetical protein